MTTTTTIGNGHGEQGELPYALPDERKIAVQNGILALQQIEQERDEHRRRLEETRIRLAELQAEHDALKLAYARAQAEMTTYRQDRDDAVASQAKFEAVFDAVLTIMQKHRAAPESGPEKAKRLLQRED